MHWMQTWAGDSFAWCSSLVWTTIYFERYHINHILANDNLVQEREPPDVGSDGGADDFYDAEILDEMTTNRGELKLRTSSLKEERFHQARNTYLLCPEDFFFFQKYLWWFMLMMVYEMVCLTGPSTGIRMIFEYNKRLDNNKDMLQVHTNEDSYSEGFYLTWRRWNTRSFWATVSERENARKNKVNEEALFIAHDLFATYLIPRKIVWEGRRHGRNGILLGMQKPSYVIPNKVSEVLIISTSVISFLLFFLNRKTDWLLEILEIFHIFCGHFPLLLVFSQFAESH